MNLLQKIGKHPASIILFATILILFSNWLTFFISHITGISEDGIGFTLLSAVIALGVLCFLPLYLAKVIFHKKPRDLGLRLPDRTSSWLTWSFIILAIFLPIMLFLSRQPAFQEYYAVKPTVWTFLILNAISSLYYFAEEFLFRGFLFFGLWNRLKFHTYWITGLLFAAFHIGKPNSEVLLAFILSLTLSHLSYKTKSFLPAACIHFVLAFVLNILVTFVYVPQVIRVFHF
jgi:membrane protease YdiL (CAAX protease family)